MLARRASEEREVGNDQVHAELVRIGEHHAGVDEDGGLLPRHGHHVHAELTEAPQRDHLERARNDLGNCGLLHTDPSHCGRAPGRPGDDTRHRDTRP